MESILVRAAACTIRIRIGTQGYGCTRIRLRWGPLQFKSMPLVPGQGLYRRYLLLKHGRG